MDSKALAKSKRAHSLQNSKKHSQAGQKAKAKAPSGGGNDARIGNKTVDKQARERARQYELPSNWDRYEDEFDSGSEDPSGDSINKASDVIFPKSKGADYRHLIAEAHSQHQSDSYLDAFPSLDDTLPGNLGFGVGPMLSVRGEGILSWIGDDNFVVENDTAVSSEAHSISLNLNALADQLANVDISKRLFIEADILPPELSDHGTKATGNLESDQEPVSETEVTSPVSEESTLKSSPEKNKVVKQSSEALLSRFSVNGHSNPDLDIVRQTTGDLNSRRDSYSGQNRAPGSPAGFSASSVATSEKKPSTAEAELDMLLDSFSETNLLDSSGFKSGPFPSSNKEASRALPQLAGNTSNSSKMISTAAKLDDALDDLLEETSILSNQSNPHSTTKLTPPNQIQPSFSESVTKSKVLDDFDSWMDTL